MPVSIAQINKPKRYEVQKAQDTFTLSIGNNSIINKKPKNMLLKVKSILKSLFAL